MWVIHNELNVVVNWFLSVYVCVTSGPIKYTRPSFVSYRVVVDRENTDLRQPRVNIYERIEKNKTEKNRHLITLHRMRWRSHSLGLIRTKWISCHKYTETQFSRRMSSVCLCVGFYLFSHLIQMTHVVIACLLPYSLYQDKVEITCVRCVVVISISLCVAALWSLNLWLSSRNTLVINVVHASDAQNQYTLTSLLNCASILLLIITTIYGFWIRIALPCFVTIDVLHKPFRLHAPLFFSCDARSFEGKLEIFFSFGIHIDYTE